MILNSFQNLNVICIVFIPVTAVDSAKKAMEFLGLKDGKVKRKT
jgi:hypothetical protein